MASDSDEEPEMHPYDPFSQDISPFQYQDPLSNSTILNAVALNDIEKVQELINAGKSVNVTDNNGCSALHIAISKKSNEMVQLLLKHEINVDHQNFVGNTPLLFALSHGSVHSIIIQLLEFGCNVNIKNNIEDTALHLAVVHSSPEIIQLLIEHGADINAQDGSLFTPLHQAAHYNKLSAVYILLYYNANTNMLCHANLTPFMYSLMNIKGFEITEILFNYYDEFTHVTSLGETAFMLAVRRKNPIAIDLLKAGLNCGFRSTDIKEALCYLMNINLFDLFKTVLVQFSNGCIMKGDFLYIFHRLVTIKTLSTSAWIDYFYLLVEAGLKNPFGNYGLKTVLNGLFRFIQTNKIDINNRQRILWAFLSLGVNVERSSLVECCAQFGNGVELEILYQFYTPKPIFSRSLPPYSPPLLYFDGMLNSTPSNLKLKLEMTYCRYLRHLFDSGISQESIDNRFYVGYMSFAPCVLPTLADIDCGNHKGFILQTISLLPEIPSLLELSRNASALHIVSTFNIIRPYQFFDVVNRADFPKFVKELLLFRKPVYYV